jgi:hypothetical protein
VNIDTMFIRKNVNKRQPSNGMFPEARKGREFQRTISINGWLSYIYFALANEGENET